MPLDRKHWEELVGNIVDAIGVERFTELVAYVLIEQRGYERLSVACELLHRMAALRAEVEDAN